MERRPPGPPVTSDGKAETELVMVDRASPTQAWRWCDYGGQIPLKGGPAPWLPVRRVMSSAMRCWWVAIS